MEATTQARYFFKTGIQSCMYSTSSLPGSLIVYGIYSQVSSKKSAMLFR